MVAETVYDVTVSDGEAERGEGLNKSHDEETAHLDKQAITVDSES